MNLKPYFRYHFEIQIEIVLKYLKHCEALFPNNTLFCIIEDPHNLCTTLRSIFEKIRQKLGISKIHLTCISLKKEKIVTRETMMNFYKGNVKFYEKSIGDALEDFRVLVSF